ncbi:hypothetical protein [Inhella proteolytica]|uniref:Uncharacterized protein n=1 Tax=Inhella proteolytica TaxID=2795029 RepID=A0A931IXA5_9BURK|nr:hypothetical protein [Inhella proteolytica]MBH9575439.1 hypothetical protein [Inhella proteolytica]
MNELRVLPGVATVIRDPLRFKARLAIGEDAYAELRTTRSLRQWWDVLGAAGTGAALTKGALAAAVGASPIGWVMLGALASGGAWYGLHRHLAGQQAERVTVIPNCIQTPLDLLGLMLFDLVAPLSLKLAALDRQLDTDTRQRLSDWLVEGWGYEPAFVAQGLALLEPQLQQVQIRDLAQALAQLLHGNPDCQPEAMAKELLRFQRELLGPTPTEMQELALAHVEQVLRAPPAGSLGAALSQAGQGLGQAARIGAQEVSELARQGLQAVRERAPGKEELRELAQRGLQQAQRLGDRLGTQARQRLKRLRDR